MTTLNTDDAAAIERAAERASRAGDELNEGQGILDDLYAIENKPENALELAALAQARSLNAIAGYLGALTELALTALRQEGAK